MRSKPTGTVSSAIQLKRAYEPAEPSDGVRVLVDRLWARGLSKDDANLDAWMKELGPTTALRKWFGHQPERWRGFAGKYRLELTAPLCQLLLAELQGIAAGSPVTLVYGARDTQENEAVVLRQYLLHDAIHSHITWNASTKLLVTVSVVAAAYHDASAPASGLKLFAAPILAAQEFDGALQELLTCGMIRSVSDGWQLTSRGEREARQVASADSARGAPS